MAERDEEARRAILAHHQELLEGVRIRVAALAGAVAAGEPYDAPRAELVAYLAGEVLPHAAAEEDTIYPAASRVGQDAQVDDMVGEHRTLEATVESMAAASDPRTCATQADEFELLFARHVADENDILLPALLSAEGVSLADVLAEMAKAYSAAKQGAEPAGGATGAETVLAPALTDALVALAEAGQADRASRIAAVTWSRLRHHHPGVAVRLTALLHRLVRLEPPSVPVVLTERVSARGEDPELDVRQLAPAQRHQVIFTTYAALGAGAGFVLVNDHDPKPLRYQFAAEHAGEFTWDYLETGPTVWRVRIGRPAEPAVA